MRRVLLGEIIARDSEDEVGRLGRAGHAEHGAREEDTVRLGRGKALELAGGSGVDLRLALMLKLRCDLVPTVLVSMKMVVRPRPPGTIPSPLSDECCYQPCFFAKASRPTSCPLKSWLYTDVTASSLPKLVNTRSALALATASSPRSHHR